MRTPAGAEVTRPVREVVADRGVAAGAQAQRDGGRHGNSKSHGRHGPQLPCPPASPRTRVSAPAGFPLRAEFTQEDVWACEKARSRRPSLAVPCDLQLDEPLVEQPAK